MNKIKICYLILLVCTVCHILFFAGGLEGIKAGWMSANDSNPLAREQEVVKPVSGKQAIAYNPERDKGAGISENTPKLQKSNRPWVLIICRFIIIAAFLGMGTAFFIQLYQFARSVSKNKIFEKANIKRLTGMGALCILMGIVSFQFSYISLYTKQPSITPSPGVSQNIDFEFWPFILGLVLLTIGYSFKKGLELKKENDATI